MICFIGQCFAFPIHLIRRFYTAQSLIRYLGLILAMTSFPGYSTEYFVAPGGSGNGAKDAPFGEIDQALAVAQPHDIITLRAGTYKPPFFPNDDTINIPHLTIQGFQGERPHIKSDYGNGKKIALWIGAEAEHMILRNLEISGGDIYTLKLETYWDWPQGGNHRARGVIIENSEIHHGGTDIIKITPEADDVIIRNSHIHHSCLFYTSGDAKRAGENTEYPNCQAIDNVNSDRMLVQGNHIHDIPYGNPALFFKGGAMDVVVERNRIENAYTGVAIGAQTDIDFYSPEVNPAPHYNSFNGIVRNNIIRNMRGDCISLMAAKTPRVYNNTLIDCGSEEEGKGISFRHQPTWGDQGAMNHPTTEALIVNNLVISKAQGTNPYGDFLIEVRGYDDNNILAVEEGSLMMDYNIYWDPRYSDLRARNFNNFSSGVIDYVTLAEWQGSFLHDPAYAERHTEYLNPQVDADGNLLAGSPAIGTGMRVEGLTEDFFGNPRNGTVDIGAIAYQANNTMSVADFESDQAGSNGRVPSNPSREFKTTSPGLSQLAQVEFIQKDSVQLDNLVLGKNTISDTNSNDSKLKVPQAGSYYHGTYPGGKTGAEDDILPKDVASYERTVGKRAAWVYFSNNWYRSRAFPKKTATWITKRGSVPFIRIMMRSSDNNPTPDPVFTLNAINRGKFDKDFRAWGRAAKAFGRPLIVEWGTEMNGSWFAWNAKHNGKKSGSVKFRRAYRRIIRIIERQGAKNITWVFHVNGDDDPVAVWNKLEYYYPGHDVIDWIGVSIYSAQSPQDNYWTNFINQMDEVYPRLTTGKIGQGNKPIMLLEFGAAANNPNGNQAIWARKALNSLFSDRWPRLRGFSWWNEKWENDNNPVHDTNMRVQDNPALAKVIRRILKRESRYVVTRPVY